MKRIIQIVTKKSVRKAVARSERYNRERERIRDLIRYVYTEWTILIHPVKYLENQARERKIFQIKVVWFRRNHKMVPLV